MGRVTQARFSQARLGRRLRQEALKLLHRVQPLHFPSRAERVVAAARPAELIDVREMMRRHSPAEHLARADAYFVRADEKAALSRRPFQLSHETQPRLYGLSAILQGLRIETGMRLLDFGAGTGWLSRCFGYLGCDVTGVDVSARSLAMAQEFLDRDPLRHEIRVDFRHFDGIALPVADASLDRIVCFDAFHHVLDQAATLREFARVLKPGGIAAFHEPGPQHSRTPQAQHEMRQFDVIENDIEMESIWAAAQSCGFARLELAVAQPQAELVDIHCHRRIAAGRPNATDIRVLIQNIVDQSYNLRIFFLTR